MKLTHIFKAALMIASIHTAHAQAIESEIEPLITMPSGHFFENLTYLNDNELIATDYTGMTLYKYQENGAAKLWTKVKGHPVSIRFDGSGNGLLVVHEISIVDGDQFRDGMALYKVNGKNGELTLTKRLDFPAFLNGMAHLSGSKYLIADAYNGKVHQFDTETNELTTWYEGDLLKPNPETAELGVNGIQLHKGDLYFTNYGRKTMGKITINNGKAHQASQLHSGFSGDDFIIDENDNWYITTHHQEVMKLTPDFKEVTLIEHGIEGNTAIQKSKNLDNVFFITNDGGFMFGGTGEGGLKKVTFK